MITIKTLLISEENIAAGIELPEYLELTVEGDKLEPGKDMWDLIIMNRQVYPAEKRILKRLGRAYCFFVMDSVELDADTREVYDCLAGQVLEAEQLEDFLKNRARDYFSTSYGEKLISNEITVGQAYMEGLKYNGMYSAEISGDFGEDFTQLFSWKKTVNLYGDQAMDLWLEYRKNDSVEIMMQVQQFVMGSVSEVARVWDFTEEDLQQVVTIENPGMSGSLFFSIRARGHGTMELVGLHTRLSRHGLGTFVVGDDRISTSDREEVFCYFDPGDLKPPMNVYFSGYKTKEGFEGYYMMHGMGNPFLLIADQRLEGGGFYLGSYEYEQAVVAAIHKYMRQLNFTPDQVIMSGISMGTIGSMYYGADIKPHALLLGKPLASLGTIAANERINRPGGFATSLDLLRYHAGDLRQESVDRLDERFWNKFGMADWSNTKIIASYMLEDDYDSTAYQNMIERLNSTGVQIYGKGLHGRHNDNTNGIVTWFKGQYQKILREDFGRE